MLLLGPDGGNLEITQSGVILRRKQADVAENSTGATGAAGATANAGATAAVGTIDAICATKVPFEDVLCVEIIDGYQIKISYTDLSVNRLCVKTFCQAAIDVEMLQNVFAAIKVSFFGAIT